MRLQTPLTKSAIGHHFAYDWWKYLLVFAVSLMGWNLIYTTNAYRAPQEKRIDVYVQSAIADTDVINAFLAPIWQETVPEMETVQSVALITADEYTTGMQLTTYIFAGEGDIYLLKEQYFKTYAAQGVFLPLEGLVDEGTIRAEGVDLSRGYVTVVTEYGENDLPLASEQHLYGIPLDTFYGFMDGMLVDNRGLYAVILYNNQNDENVIPFFDAMLQAGRGEKADWITE